MKEDEETGKCSQVENFNGKEKMGVKKEQMYLGDVISEDGKHDKNIQARQNKSLGIITQIMQILESVFFGKYYFEVALILRSSLLLSSILLNSEAWVNLTEKNIRTLEQMDEMLLSKIMGCDSNTSNVFKYLELGVCPVRFEIKKRKLLFLHYLLKEDSSTMVYKVLKATVENPVKNDFVQTCEKYMRELNINLTFEQFGKLSKWSARKIVKQKVTDAAFEYLQEEKNKQTKISNLIYDKLELKEYLRDGNKNNDLSKVIFRARSLTLDIKLHKRWKYQDTICVGCGEREESGNELLTCDGFSDGKDGKKYFYNLFFDGSPSEMAETAKVLQKRIKVRKKLMEEKIEEEK